MGVEEDLAREAHTCARFSCLASTLDRSAAKAAGRDAKDREDAVNGLSSLDHRELNGFMLC